MNRSEVLRAKLSRSPLGHHSLNQSYLKRTFDGEKRLFGLIGKGARVRERETRKAEELRDYELKKLSRVASRVVTAFSGCDVSTSWEVLAKEIKHIRSFNIRTGR